MKLYHHNITGNLTCKQYEIKPQFIIQNGKKITSDLEIVLKGKHKHALEILTPNYKPLNPSQTTTA